MKLKPSQNQLKVPLCKTESMGVQIFHGKRQHPLLWAGSRDAAAEITVTGILNSLKYCVNLYYVRD